MILLFSLVHYRGAGQISKGGDPPSTVFGISSDSRNIVTINQPSLDAVRAEDEQFPSPFRFAVNLTADISPGKSGTWTDLPGGGRIWRITLKAPGAKAITTFFDSFHIPMGGRLFLYDTDKRHVLGAYSEINNSKTGYFATELIPGEEETLEYYQPSNADPSPAFHVYGIAYAYRGVTDLFPGDESDGTAGACEVNVKCPEGNNWQEQKDGILRIQVRKGLSSYWCSGSVVNNVRYDHKPYVLTANHCGYNASAEDLQQWIFYFNYESSQCPNPGTPPAANSMTGAVYKANAGDQPASGSDFYLVLLNEYIPESIPSFYNGWSRETTPSPSGVCLHHPEGDIKKISTYTTPLISTSWNGQPNLTHWKVTWAATPNGHGVTEGGSSGSPIFDFQGRIVGNLTGGDSSCDTSQLNSPDYYGKFSWSWESNGTDSTRRLRDWLDPDNTGVMYLDGSALNVIETKGFADAEFFPNPVKDVLTVTFRNAPTTGFDLSLFNLYGQEVANRQVSSSNDNSFQMDLSHLPGGIYFLRIQKDGTGISRKIIKQ
jgi:hypothetical protein